MNTLSIKYPAFLRLKKGAAAGGKNTRYRLPIVAEVLLLALIAWLASKLFLIAITPIETGAGVPLHSSRATSTLAADYGVLTAYDPFSALEVVPGVIDSSTITAAETTLDIAVSGMMVLEGGLGSAIIKSTNGGEQTYLVGDEIENGVTLERLEPGRAIISRNGVLEGVTVETDRVVQVTARPEAEVRAAVRTVPTPRQTINLDRLSEIFNLRPDRDSSGSMTGTYVVVPGRDAVAFAATGLASGDIIRRVNNKTAPANPERLFQMLNDVTTTTMIELTVDRGGEQMTVTLNIAELQ